MTSTGRRTLGSIHSFIHSSVIHSLSLYSGHVPKRVGGVLSSYNELCLQHLRRGKVSFSHYLYWPLWYSSLMCLNISGRLSPQIFALRIYTFSSGFNHMAYVIIISPSSGLCETFLDHTIKKFLGSLYFCHVIIN